MKVAIAQINPIVGDFEYNFNKIVAFCDRVRQSAVAVDIIAFPECAICGYNPQDLALRDNFINCSERIVTQLVGYSVNLPFAIIVGGLSSVHSPEYKAYNSVYFIYKGEIVQRHDKVSLPNHGVFDERRLYASGSASQPIDFKGKSIGMLICEDIWANVICNECDVTIVVNASPYEIHKHNTRSELLQRRAVDRKTDIVYVNMVGGQDSIVYDGGSMVVAKDGAILHQSRFFEETLDIIDLSNRASVPHEEIDIDEHIYRAILLSLKDYVSKNHMTSVALGLSGGIDSALTAVLAIDALGVDNVALVTMPSRYSSKETFEDANILLRNLGKSAINIPIESVFTESLRVISDQELRDITCENLQSRIRGLILMALSNEHGHLLLSTGNKSELSVGYATLYGDMNGGFNLLKDLYKTDVYRLARWINNQKNRQVIPESIITKAPTAELKHNQKDSDNLPEYAVLDSVLMEYIERGKSRDEIISELKLPAEIVDKILKLVRIAQFKRNQATLGPKIRNMSFGLEWRMPVTNGFWK